MAAPIFVSALILTFVAYTTTGMLVCPDGWQKHINNQCYWFSDFNTSKQSAQSECELRNSSLVITDNTSINTFLKQHISNDKDISYWIGLSIPNIQAGAWQWTSGLQLDTRHVDWCDGDDIVANFLSSCTVAYYFTNATFCLRTYSCATSRRFVCEKEIDRHDELCPSHLHNNSYAERRSCYFVNVDKETHTDAAKVCWSKGMRLVTVPDDGARRFMESISPGNKQVFWVGLSPYKWIDESAYNWYNWDIEGSRHILKCTTIKSNGEWHSSKCSESHNFICQKDAVVATFTTSATSVTRQTTMITRETKTETTVASESSIKQTDMTTATTYQDSTILKSTTQLDGISYPVSRENSSLIPSELADDEKHILLYILIGIYSAVGVTTIVFIGLLTKYLSLRRRHKMDSEKPIEVELDDDNLDEDDDFKLYDNPDYVGVEHQEQYTSAETKKLPAIVNDSLIYSETSVPGQVVSTNSHKEIETKCVPTSRDDDVALEDIALDTKNHEVINGDVYAVVDRSRSLQMSTDKSSATENHTSENVALTQLSDSISKGDIGQMKTDNEPSDHEDDGHVYYNNPHNLNTNSNFEDDNIYDDAINVTIPESVNSDTEDDKL